MRKRVALLGTIVLIALAGPVSAQQFSSSIGSAMTGGATTTTGTMSSFFSRAMTRPDMSAMSFRPTVPTPLNFNMMSMLPTFPNLQNTMLLRNVFGPQTSVTLPKQATPPPKKK